MRDRTFRPRPFGAAVIALGLAMVAGPAQAQNSFIHERRDIPDDPLAGLGESGAPPRQGRPKTPKSPRCHLVPRAADTKAIGDLRALLLAARHIPDRIPCDPARLPKAELRLRIAISGQGKVLRIERIGGDEELARQVRAMLEGRSCPPRAQGETVGEIIFGLKTAKPSS